MENPQKEERPPAPPAKYSPLMRWLIMLGGLALLVKVILVIMDKC
jgi:hypothetical protein